MKRVTERKKERERKNEGNKVRKKEREEKVKDSGVRE